MSKIARITDTTSCGDFLATGSNNVFANGLPISLEDVITTGHPGAAPTTALENFSNTVFINNKAVCLDGKTKMKKHPDAKHQSIVNLGSSDCEIE